MIADGPPPEALVDIATAALAGDKFTVNDEQPTHLLPASFELSAFDQVVIDALADAVSRAAEDAEIVLLDLMLDQKVVRFGAIEQLLYSAIEKLAEVWPVGASLVVLTTRVPHSDDDIAQILHLEGLAGAVLFLDEKGLMLGNAWDDGERLDRVSDAAVNTPRELIGYARRRSARRGVFRVATSPREDYAAFRYSVGDIELAEVLRGYFHANDINVAVFESDTEHWLGVAVQGASSEGTPAFPTSDLNAGGDRAAEFSPALREKLSDPANRVCLVIPMLKNGERATALLKAVGRSDVDVLTIFHASLDQAAPARPTPDDWAEEADSESLGRPVRFIFPVKLKRLRPTDWRVQLAQMFHEDLEDRDWPNWTPSRTGIWSLLHARRKQAGYRRRDHGVLMRMSLDDWDAGWLAASLMQIVRARLGKNDDEVLMVLPADPDTAIAAIGEALKTQQLTTVVRVPRDVIDNGGRTISVDVAKQIKRFSNGAIVLVDESAATYRTLTGLNNVVTRVIKRGADLAAVVLDLPEGDAKPPADVPMASIYGWRPAERKTYRTP